MNADVVEAWFNSHVFFFLFRSVSPRRSSIGQEEPLASVATTATLVHFAETGDVEMEV